jgi:hypothetical protein
MSTASMLRNDYLAEVLETLDQLLKRLTVHFKEVIQLQRHMEPFTSVADSEATRMIMMSKIAIIEDDITEFREVSQTINVIDIVNVCMDAGATWHEALLEARREMEGWRMAMNMAEEEIAEIRRNMVWKL